MAFAERFARHSTDNGLLAIIAGEPVTPHVSSCAGCQARLDALRAWTDGVAAEAGAIADQAFTPEVLAAQKMEILRRLEQAGRSARVIAFPVGAPASSAGRTHGIVRWAAAAAVAGVMVGIGAMRLIDTRAADAPPVAAARPAAESPSALPVATRSEGLDEAALLNAAYDRVAVDALQTIDDMTPRAREAVLASMPRSRR